MRERFRSWSAQLVFGLFACIVGLACIAYSIAYYSDWTPIAGGIVVLLVGVSLAFNRNIFTKLTFGSKGLALEWEPLPAPVQKTLDPEQHAARENYAKANPPPAVNAPEFNALTDAPDVASVPAADPMVPMYVLDVNFRIIDWNEAFSLAFDRTLEGRRGQSALEWVYFLENFQEVLDHGRDTFSDPKSLPTFDVETLRYTSLRYGQLAAVKRAYQIPDDNGVYAGWLILLDLEFADAQQGQQFHFDLIRTLSRSLMWSEYALSYDELLTNTTLYQELIRLITGQAEPLRAIPEHTRILDLGAGTGNIARLLGSQRRTVFAVENNRTMLNVLRTKCHSAPLRRDDAGPGVIAIKQDINSLFGLPNSYFDYVIANNVLYSLPDPLPCLREVCRVIKPDGEVRASGPKRGFSISHLFRKIRSDLVHSDKFDELKAHFENASKINQYLEPELRRWSERDHCALFQKAKLELTRSPVPYYRGNGEILVARRG